MSIKIKSRTKNYIWIWMLIGRIKILRFVWSDCSDTKNSKEFNVKCCLFSRDCVKFDLIEIEFRKKKQIQIIAASKKKHGQKRSNNKKEEKLPK